jgi:regulatory protein
MASTVTALKQQKRNPNRVNIYLDGDFTFGLSKILAASLKVGQRLSDEEQAELQSKDEGEKAYQRALNFISYRPRSNSEVERNLRKHAVSDEIIEEVVERLLSKGILDDVAFAELWIENRSAFRPRGRYALRSELRQKGIQDAVIDLALIDIDEESLARLATQKKLKQLAGLEWNQFRSKLSAYLSRRGFEYSLVSEICKESWELLQTS